MPRATLSFDGEALRRLSTTLSGVKTVFDAPGAATVSPEHLGHPRLAQRVDSFTRSWDDTRRVLSDEIGGLSTSAMTIADGFTAADEGLAAALPEEEASS
jgi:hypothetical protein